MLKHKTYTEKAAILQGIQTGILLFFLFQMFTPTSELSKLPDALEYILMFANVAILASFVTSSWSFVLLRDAKRANEVSKLRTPVMVLAVVNIIAAILYLGMWIFVFIGAFTGNVTA